MLCPHCGKPIEEGAGTCPYCGASLQQNPRPEESAPLYTRPPQETPPPAYNTSEPPVIRLMRRTARSPLFLVPAIGYTCMVVFSLAAALQSASPAAVDSYVAQLAPYGTDAQMESIYHTLSTAYTAVIGGALVGYIPSILIVAGIWMTFASLRNESGTPIKTAGLTMIRVLQIIGLVFVCLVALVVLIIMGVLMATLGTYDDSGAANAAVVAILLVTVAVVALTVFYSVKTIGTIDCFRKSIWTGTPQGKISAFVAVMSILGGVGSLLAVFTGNVYSTLGGIAGAVSGIGFGVFLFRYRDELRNLSSPAQTWSAE